MWIFTLSPNRFLYAFLQKFLSETYESWIIKNIYLTKNSVCPNIAIIFIPHHLEFHFRPKCTMYQLCSLSMANNSMLVTAYESQLYLSIFGNFRVQWTKLDFISSCFRGNLYSNTKTRWLCLRCGKSFSTGPLYFHDHILLIWEPWTRLLSFQIRRM